MEIADRNTSKHINIVRTFIKNITRNINSLEEGIGLLHKNDLSTFIEFKPRLPVINNTVFPIIEVNSSIIHYISTEPFVY